MSKRHWNYRVIQYDTEGEVCQAIHEVHYVDDVPVAYSENPSFAYGEDAAELGRVLDRMRTALAKPVLLEAEFRPTVEGDSDAANGAV